ncbi:UDP-glycosyltransferase 73E1 [Clarias magur]|uniref:UDP-glycosyltransferase 73E1 n=1 Tax=Clarias magur TaxID=1594786 RepID=A0A8J4UJG4_CLAMG|nr:UDP-glycosyltransferase 73E1 [Clarias magur]
MALSQAVASRLEEPESRSKSEVSMKEVLLLSHAPFFGGWWQCGWSDTTDSDP